jgi:hypothetical protein
MLLFRILSSFSQEIAMSIQPGAASAIYWSIVLAAISLASLVMYESLVDRGDGRPTNQTAEDQPLKQAA